VCCAPGWGYASATDKIAALVLTRPARWHLWPQWRSPLVWDVFAISTYLLVSALFWYLGMLPDLATLRDRARTRGKQVAYGPLALGWRSRDAAGGLRALGGGDGLRDRQHAGLPLDDLPALLRRRRAVFRLRDGADDRDPAAPRVRPEGPHHYVAAPRARSSSPGSRSWS
jgi:hypothetical protein